MEVTVMNLFHKTSAITFSILHPGFQVFKDRIREELSATSGVYLDDVMDDDSLYKIYRDGESAEFVVASINGPMVDFDDDEAA
ncbi:MAG: hypothetical protein IKJ76_03715 [Fibrobacter sp.]|jgi:hypothetical protein|nr:hypothetical protein [Fibrobacter sp.]MBR3851137.1 hypothetical protein [Fibrobacter sp.]